MSFLKPLSRYNKIVHKINYVIYVKGCAQNEIETGVFDLLAVQFPIPSFNQHNRCSLTDFLDFFCYTQTACPRQGNIKYNQVKFSLALFKFFYPVKTD